MTNQISDQHKQNFPLFQYLRAKILAHFSFILIVTSSGLFFFFNLWLKSVLSDVEYGEYGLLNSYLTIALSFGVIGGDQLIMRTARYDGKVTLLKSNIIYSYWLITFFSISSSLIIVFILNLKVNIWLIIICSLFSGLTILTFSVFRVSNLFSLAQIQKNLWRLLVFVFCVVIYYFFNIKVTLNIILLSIVSGLGLTLLISIKYLRKINLGFDAKVGIDYNLWFGFFISMIVMNLMTNGDRFFIDKYIDRSNVGHYFYLQNLFLFPLTQIQNYSGFKELIIFKKEFSYKKLRKSITRNVFIAIGAALILAVFFTLYDFLFKSYLMKFSNLDIIIIVFLLINGSIRIVYSVVSAAMGAVGNKGMILRANIITITFLIPMLITFLILPKSIISISILFLVFWLIRTGSFYFILKRYEI